jgi:hypothetical protein
MKCLTVVIAFCIIVDGRSQQLSSLGAVSLISTQLDFLEELCFNRTGNPTTFAELQQTLEDCQVNILNGTELTLTLSTLMHTDPREFHKFYTSWVQISEYFLHLLQYRRRIAFSDNAATRAQSSSDTNATKTSRPRSKRVSTNLKCWRSAESKTSASESTRSCATWIRKRWNVNNEARAGNHLISDSAENSSTCYWQQIWERWMLIASESTLLHVFCRVSASSGNFPQPNLKMKNYWGE